MATSVYEDKFARADNTDINADAPMGGSYTEITSDFQIVSEKLKAINTTGHLAVVDSPTINNADYYVQAVVRCQSGFAASVGLVARYQDSNNYYYAHIDPFGGSGQILKIGKVIAGVDSSLGTYSGGYVDSVDYTLKFELTGTSLKAYVNGTLRITVSDSALSLPGKAGFRSGWANMTWDKFAIVGDITKAAIPAIGNDYSQPPLPRPLAGWGWNSIDQQVVTKDDNWNQDSTKRNLEFDQVLMTGANYVALAVPYGNPLKYTNYVNGARAKGLKVFHRSHWDSWEGDNGLPSGLSRQDYLADTYRFITENPDLFAAGDLFGMCVEPNNADGHSNYTFRTPETSGGTFDIDKFNTFMKDMVRYSNQAFTDIGLGGTIWTWAISPSVDLLDLNGQSWTTTSGRADGLDYNDFLTYFGGVVALDHYSSDSIDNGNSYYTAYNNDFTKFALSFPGCNAFIGEFGYPTTTTRSDGNQYGVFDKIAREVHRAKSYIIGVNYWVQFGSNTASLWTDVAGTITKGGRIAVKAIESAFKSSNAANNNYGRILKE